MAERITLYSGQSGAHSGTAQDLEGHEHQHRFKYAWFLYGDLGAGYAQIEFQGPDDNWYVAKGTKKTDDDMESPAGATPKATVFEVDIPNLGGTMAVRGYQSAGTTITSELTPID